MNLGNHRQKHNNYKVKQIFLAALVMTMASCTAATGFEFRSINPPPEEQPDRQPITNWCSPQAVNPVSLLAHSMLDWVDESLAGSCVLDSVRADVGGDGTIESVEEILPIGQDGELLTIFARSWEVRPSEFEETFGDVSYQRPVGIFEARSLENGHLLIIMRSGAAGMTTERLAEQEFNSDRNIVLSRHYRNEQVWLETVLDWDGELLVEATETESPTDNDPIVRRFTWRYDSEDRLIESRLLREGEQPREQIASWTYGEDLMSVDRRVDGHSILVQTWFFDENNLLIARETDLVNGFVSIDFGIRKPALDDLMPRAVFNIVDPEVFEDALPRSGQECSRLPASISHGYPEAEGVWNLGWPRGDRPEGIGYDYGYSGYAFDYGQSAWFGHGGVGEINFFGNNRRLNRTEYGERGRMISDEFTYDLAAESVSVSRTRQYDGDLLTEDHQLVVQGDDEQVTSFRFIYDSSGNLVERRYLIDDQIVALHEWSYTDEGEISEHRIAFHGARDGYAIGQRFQIEIQEIPDGLSDDPEENVSFLQQWSMDGREMNRFRLSPDLEEPVHERRELRNEDGHIAELEITRWETVLQRVVFNSDNQLEFEGQDWDGDGEFDVFQRWSFSPDGFLAQKEMLNSSTETRRITDYLRICE